MSKTQNKLPFAFLFYYRTNARNPNYTSVWVVAFTAKQATYFFNKYLKEKVGGFWGYDPEVRHVANLIRYVAVGSTIPQGAIYEYIC